MNEHVTLMPPDPSGPTPRALSAGLPDDLLSQAAERLRILALLYAFVFFMAGILPALLISNDRSRFLGSFVQWGPAVIGILVGLLVAAVIRSPRLPLRAAMTLGLVFEIVSSYAIAASEFADPAALENHRGNLGLSWVAVWVVLFTVVVPTSPRRALLAALASVTSVPVVIWARDRIWHHFGPRGSRTVLPRPRLSLPPRRGHGVCRRPRGLPARYRGQACSRPGELSSGGEARRGGNGRGLARAASHAGETSRHQADPAIRRRACAPEQVVLLLRQVCHSLSEAQSCGLVHRDIKPANILLCRYGEEYDFVKVLDFGIVGTTRDPADTNPTLTQENAVQGTPGFIAPEQAMGTSVDGRADIYAIGCVAYWLLTGQFVFRAETPLGLLLQHAQTPPAPPSARTDLPIPRALDDLVLSCLAKDPADRPQCGQRAVASAGRSGRRKRLDSGAGARVVGNAPALVSMEVLPGTETPTLIDPPAREGR